MQSIDDILGVLQEWAQNKVPVDPGAYLEASLKIMSLIGNETDRQYELERQIAEYKATLMEEEGMTAAKAKIKAEASPIFTEARKLKAKVERIYEMVRIAKARARMASDEFKGN